MREFDDILQETRGGLDMSEYMKPLRTFGLNESIKISGISMKPIIESEGFLTFLVPGTTVTTILEKQRINEDNEVDPESTDGETETDDAYDKQYIGQTGPDTHYYFVKQVNDDTGELEDLVIANQDEEIIASAKEMGVDLNNELEFLMTAIPQSEINQISFDFFEQSVLPLIKQQAEAEEEPEEDTESDSSISDMADLGPEGGELEDIDDTEMTDTEEPIDTESEDEEEEPEIKEESRSKDDATEVEADYQVPVEVMIPEIDLPVEEPTQLTPIDDLKKDKIEESQNGDYEVVGYKGAIPRESEGVNYKLTMVTRGGPNRIENLINKFKAAGLQFKTVYDMDRVMFIFNSIGDSEKAHDVYSNRKIKTPEYYEKFNEAIEEEKIPQGSKVDEFSKGNVKISIIKRDGEYINRWYEDGIYSEEKTNYTDDKEDAIQTAKKSLERVQEGIDLEEVARLNGFDSVDALKESILNEETFEYKGRSIQILGDRGSWKFRSYDSLSPNIKGDYYPDRETAIYTVKRIIDDSKK